MILKLNNTLNNINKLFTVIFSLVKGTEWKLKKFTKTILFSF